MALSPKSRHFTYCIACLECGALFSHSKGSDIIRKYDLNFHLYADDTQVYIAFDPTEAHNFVGRIETCISEIKKWMNRNYLKLNDDKTEVILFGTKTKLKDVSIGCLHWQHSYR